uniref:Retinol dehydrogenase 12 n=1 Tax=Syphacia muris TaxID=451379 RepID=A0A0N5AEK4_9BILA
MKGGQFSEDISADGKIAVVTGANSGIGRQIAKELNLRGAKVYMLCRDKMKGIKAIDELEQEGCDIKRLLLNLVDLADFETIRKFSHDVQRHVDKIDILVNCAAVFCHPNDAKKTIDKHDVTWQVNYLGHFYLTEMLLPLLKKSSNGRIINVSCGWHIHADIPKEPSYAPIHLPAKLDLYCQTKLALVMHAVELTRRIRNEDSSCTVVVNACDPGICYTSLYRTTVLHFWPLRIILLPFLAFLLKSDKDGAQTPVYMALSKHLESVSGKYFALVICQFFVFLSNFVDFYSKTD